MIDNHRGEMGGKKFHLEGKWGITTAMIGERKRKNNKEVWERVTRNVTYHNVICIMR